MATKDQNGKPLGRLSFPNWQYGGVTAIVTYALLEEGQDPQSQPMAKAIDFLEKVDSPGIYATGLRCQIWKLIPSSTKEKRALHRDTEILLRSLKSKGEARGMYHYAAGTGNDYDHSVSQYGVLGAWACSDAGAYIPPKYWEIVDHAWRSHQYADGSWSYEYAKPGSNLPLTEQGGPVVGAPSSFAPTITMTAAGVATLFISRDMRWRSEGASAQSNGTDPNIDAGMQWLSQNFNQVFDSKKMVRWIPATDYGLFGLQRVGVASGYKKFGNIDRFQRCSDYLIKTQTPQGFWDGFGGWFPSTAFGLLFLAHGGAPVIINKLKYSDTGVASHEPNAHWDQRPRDAASFSQWMTKQLEHRLNWQIVTLHGGVNDLLDSPLLYISGDRPLKLSAEDQATLKAYVESGGIILASADGGDYSFSASIRKLGTKLFPKYEFRTLLPSDPIFTAEQYPRSHWMNKARVLGLSNVARELMLLIPSADLAKAWQAHDNAHPDLLQLGADIVLYATGEQIPKGNGDTYIIRPDPAIHTTSNINIARLRYNGNWNPEPGGWKRLSAIFHNEHHTDLQINPVTLGDGQVLARVQTSADLTPSKTGASAKSLSPSEQRTQAFKRLSPSQIMATNGDPQKLDALIHSEEAKINAATAASAAVSAPHTGPLKYPLADLTGTDPITLTDPQRAELKAYAHAGGVLLIDAAGGNSAFAESATAQLRKMFGQQVPNAPALPLASPIYSTGSKPLGKVDYRAAARQVVGRIDTPRIKCIRIDGRPAVFFSAEDLSVGLVGDPVGGIVGYTPTSATDIVSHIILWAVHH